MAANTMLKRVGARTRTCFTPFVTGNESEVSPLSITVALMLSCNRRTSAVNFLGQPNFSIICNSPSPVLQRPWPVTYITTDYSYFYLQCCDPKRHKSCHTGRVHVHFRCSRLCERVFNLFIVSQGERGGLVG